MSTPSKEETKLSKAIQAGLKSAGFHVERIQTGTHRVRGGYLHCASNGTPDLYILGFGFAEVKLPGESLNEDQEAWHRRARLAGDRVEVVSSLAEALRIVRGY